MQGVKYTDDEIFEWAKEAIAKNNLFTFEDVIAFLPCGRTRFYEACPEGSDRSDALKRMVTDNKIKTKSGIRAKLYKEKGTSLIALYKMICTDEERRALSLTYQENKQEITGQMVIVTADERERNALKRMAENED